MSTLINNPKSQVFKTAWILYRKFKIDFATALAEAWKRIKKELIKLEFATTTADEVTYRSKLVYRFNAIKISLFESRGDAQEMHRISEMNKAQFISKFGYQNWMK